MKRGLLVRSISWVLVFVLLLQIAPLQTQAVTLPTEPSDSNGVLASVDNMASPGILDEVEELREEDSKQFLMDDGSYLAVSYGMPVHYQDDEGEWIDIDNTLTSASTYSGPSTYSVANGEAATAFARNLTEGLLFSTEYKGNQVSLSLLDAAEVAQLLREAAQDDLIPEDTGLAPGQAETTDMGETAPASTEAVFTEPDSQETELPESDNDSVEKDQAEAGTEAEELHINEQNNPISTESTVNIQAVQTEASNVQDSEEETSASAEPEENAPVPQVTEETSGTETREPLTVIAPSAEKLTYDRTTIAQIVKPEGLPFTLTEDQAPLADQIIPEKLSSALLYSDVYPDVDLEYNIAGYNIKESIIVKKPLDSYSFSFRLDLNGLTPILQEDGSISLTDENGDAVYLIPAPYMFDADYHPSNAASYTVTALEDGYLLTVEADAEWINAADRAFPVTIDPTLLITAGNASGDISATYVEQGAPTTGHGSQQNLYTGYTTYAGIKERIIYMYFNQLPAIPTGSTVVNASLNLWLAGYTEINCKEMQIGAYEVTNSKPSTASSYSSWIYYMTWNTKAAYDTANMIDYTGASAAKKNSYLSWDLTELVNKWYTTGAENRTVALAGTESGSYSSTYCAEPVFYAYGQSHPPILTVSYRNNVGIEPYYTYQTMSAGNAGTAYISDFSSQLTVAKDLFSFSSTVHPFTAQLVFNSAYFAKQSDKPYDLGKDLGLEMHFGSGWTYNFIQSVKRETINGESYIRYMDGDGTLHYFAKDAQKSAEINKKTGGNKTYYFDEDGLGLKINEYHPTYYSLTDDKGNELIFVDGFLLWILDADSNKISLHYSKNGSSVAYDYPSASGARLEYITQKPYAGPETTIATFTYKSHGSVANYLATITDYAGNQYAFDYQDGNLVGIRYNNRQIASYTMAQGSGKLKSELVKMTDVEAGYGLQLAYQNHRITAVTETAGGNSGRKLAISKPDDRSTIYRDAGNDGTLNTADDILTNYGFDYSGRTVNAYTTDAAGTILGATNAVYSGTGSTDRTNNRTMRTASIGMAAQQEMRNSGFELTAEGLAWTISASNSSVSAAVATDKPRTGFKSLKLQGTQGQSGLAGAYRSSNYLPTQTTYIFSAYVNTSQAQSFTGSGVYLQITDTAGNTWKSPCVAYQTSSLVDGGWVRLNATFTTKGPGNHTIAVYADGVGGKVYVDDFQLERAKGPVAASSQADSTAVSNVNLLENGSLQYWEHGWTLNSGASFVTKCGVNSTSADAYSIRVNGNPSADNYASQTVSLNQPGTQSYVLSGWAKGNAVPDNKMDGDPKTDSEAAAKDKNKQFGLRAVLTYTDGTKEYHYSPFNPDLSAWQFTSLTIVPKQPTKTVKEIQVICAYEKNANTAWFDDLSLVKEAAQTMRYDSDGNLVSVSTTGLKADTDTYQNGNLIKSVTGGNGTFDYTYDSKHRLTSVTNGVVTQSVVYDSIGNVTSTTLKSNSTSQTKTMTSSATYGSNGNLMTSVTDASGQTLTYTYGNAQSVMRGQPTAVQDAKGNTTTTSYDDQGRATQKTFANGGTLGYNYEKGLLGTVTRTTSAGESQSVSCGYDSFGNLTDVSVGGLLLASYQYGSGNGPLEKQAYGNGEEVQFQYDYLGRVQKTTYSSGRVLTYAYTGDGYLYSVLDNAGTTLTYDDAAYFYTYDSLGRTIACQVRRGGDVQLEVRWEYDDCSRVKFQAWQAGGQSYKETFTYSAKDGSLTKIDRDNGGNDLNLSYDGLERLISASNSLYTRTYAYRDISSTKTTGQVENIGYTGLSGNLSGLSYSYAYDALGNIAAMTPSTGNAESYTYDAMGQQTGAAIGETSYSYTYDGAGNILTAQEGDVTNTYTYGNENWKDLLTAYNGQPIVYEGQTVTSGVVSGTPVSGNPIRYYNGTKWNVSWSEGRKLAAIGKNDATLYFKYDANGVRLEKWSGRPGTTETHTYFYAGEKLLRENIAASHTNSPFSNLTLDFAYDATGAPYSLTYNNGNTTATYYYITNLQGDVMYLVDETGAEVAAYTYDPYGKILSATGTMAGINPLRYRGYYQDSETGFYYLQSRYYDPEIGRFINADSYASTGQGLLGHNMFAYCNNNPANYIDPTGHFWREIWNFFETAFIETQNTIAAWAPQYSKCSEVAMADGGLPFADVAGLVGVAFLTLGAIGNGLHKAITTPPKTISKAKEEEVAATEGSATVIYRYGGTNPGNLTPSQRDVELFPITGTGLSFSTIPKPGAAMTTIEAINSTSVLFAVMDGPTHVSVFPIGGTLADWHDAGTASIWTIVLKSIVVKLG